MLFNSSEFLWFYIAVTAIFFFLAQKYRWLHLLLASCVFYAAFIPEYLLILAFTIVIDYYAGILIAQHQGRKRKFWLAASIIANVGVLAVFKYYNFFIDNLNALGGIFGDQQQFSYWNIILPIGLSFHTFQAMSYTIEVYRGVHPAERHFGIYALYVMFYPQLVAGPIERPQNVIHQFKQKHVYNAVRFKEGIMLMLWGLFKKSVIADRAAIYVNIIYENPEQYHWANLWVAAVLFSVQIYCDFSGYSDIALGAAKTMGFDLMVNFRRPYEAKNIQEFWEKWHISLSTWFRDYLYIPLGGSRISVPRTYINVVIVFLVSGLWHGANWTFVLWGGIHAALIVVHRLRKRFFSISDRLRSFLSPVSLVWTFLWVTLAWVYFRAPGIDEANSFIASMFQFEGNKDIVLSVKNTSLGFIFNKMGMLILVFAISFMFFLERRLPPLLYRPGSRLKNENLLGVGLVVAIILFGVFKQQSFIYFQF